MHCPQVNVDAKVEVHDASAKRSEDAELVERNLP